MKRNFAYLIFIGFSFLAATLSLRAALRWHARSKEALPSEAIGQAVHHYHMDIVYAAACVLVCLVCGVLFFRGFRKT